ncbi:MAG: DUF6702 family protein [Janthinobacterium lividum]
MRHFLLLLTFLVLPALAAPRHAYHTTLMELRLNPDKQQVELALKVFTDDLEKALSKGRPTAVDLHSPMALPIIELYLHEHIKVSIPAAPRRPRLPQEVRFQGMRSENDAYWLFMVVPLIHPTKELLVRETVLLDVYSDQKNIVNAEGNYKKLSALLRNGHEEEFLYF